MKLSPVGKAFFALLAMGIVLLLIAPTLGFIVVALALLTLAGGAFSHRKDRFEVRRTLESRRFE